MLLLLIASNSIPEQQPSQLLGNLYQKVESYCGVLPQYQSDGEINCNNVFILEIKDGLPCKTTEGYVVKFDGLRLPMELLHPDHISIDGTIMLYYNIPDVLWNTGDKEEFLKTIQEQEYCKNVYIISPPL